MLQIFKGFLIVFLIFIFAMCNGCTSLKPPLELAPHRDIISKALSKQLSQTHLYLSSSLKSSSPPLEIREINVSQIEPYFLENLPTYHLKGTYQLNLQFSKKQVPQPLKKFDLYLQRQKEGKTWHLIDKKNRHNFSLWLSGK